MRLQTALSTLRAALLPSVALASGRGEKTEGDTHWRNKSMMTWELFE